MKADARGLILAFIVVCRPLREVHPIEGRLRSEVPATRPQVTDVPAELTCA